MIIDLRESVGAYEIIVNETNSSVCMRLIPNDIIGMDDEYYGYQSTFLNGQKVNWLEGVGTPGTGPGGPGPTSTGSIMSSPTESTTTTPATSYGFALDGRRVSKAGAVSLKYLYDGENVIYELWNDKTVRFTHSVSSGSCGGGCSGGCAGNSASAFTDHPISITIDGVKYYYLYDGLGSVTELIDTNENVVNTYRYTPFGEALIRNELVYNPHQFTGRQYDAESGLYHYRARAYAPDVGRFMQQDPAGMVDGANMYAYCGNDPVNHRDPRGLWWFWIAVAIVIVLFGSYWSCVYIQGKASETNNPYSGQTNYDKYSHCVWTCFMRKNCGMNYNGAKAMNDNREWYNKKYEGQSQADSNCDMVANNIGQWVYDVWVKNPSSGYTCQSGCQQWWPQLTRLTSGGGYC